MPNLESLYVNSKISMA